MLRISLCALILVSVTGVAAAQNTISAPSTWVNQNGSVLTIDSIDGDGSFKGHFVNKKQGTYCLNVSYLAEGKVKDGAIWFAVTFADAVDYKNDCYTVTQWRGAASEKAFDTTWSLAYAGSSGLIVIGGSDKFDLQP
jgi:hypothetical protein